MGKLSMKIKTYTIENRSEQFVEILEPFKESDVNIITNRPELSGDNSVEGSFELRFNREDALFIIDTFKYEITDRDATDEKLSNMAVRALGEYHWYLEKRFINKVNFRGIRKQSTKEQKVNQAIMEIASDMLMNREKYVKLLLDKVNDLLEVKVKSVNKSYEEYMRNLYSGNSISQEWISENIDDHNISNELEDINEKISQLRSERKAIKKRQALARNRNMFLYLEGENWGEDGSLGHDALPQTLKEEFTELYKNGLGFTVENEFAIPKTV
jgi:hypothetical protein